MADTETGGVNAEAWWNALEVAKVVGIFLLNWFVGIVRALVPSGWLPRKSVKGQRVLVTGAGSGLGRLISIEFAKLGAKVILVDVNGTANEETKQHIVNNGGVADCYECDLADSSAINSMLESIETDLGEVDILVNNAGIVTGGKLVECSENMIKLTFDVNVLAHFWLLKGVLPSMVRRNSGHVVTISSGAGLFGCVNLVDYCSTKFAAVGLAESLALELHAHGIHEVKHTLICPYYINTGMFDGVATSPLMPILEVNYAVEKIMEAILTDQIMLLMPRTLYFLYFLKGLLPVKCGMLLADLTGVSRSMDHFKGRKSH